MDLGAADFFNFALLALLACMLWNIVHPEHFDWLRKLFPRDQNPKPVNQRLERNLLTVFYGFLIVVVAFNLNSLITYGAY